MQKPVLCCPEPAVKNPLHPHEIPDKKREDKVPVTPGLACSNPLYVMNCGDTNPPGPVTLEGQDCNGAPVEVTGTPGELTAVVQAPGTVFNVKLCGDDKDFELSCGKDPATDHEIQTVYRIEAGTMVVYGRWDVVTGQPWTGDPSTLESCSGTKLESDGREVCVNGGDLTQWVVKKDGIPTGVVYYTDNLGQLVDVPADAVVATGKCVPSCADAPIIDCDNVIQGYAYNAATAASVGATVPVETCDGAVFGYILPASAPGHTKPITLGCGADAVVIGYAADIGCASDIEQESDPIDVCINGVSATRWQVKENGVPVGVVHYTDATGTLIYPPADAVITLGHCVPVAVQSVSSATGNDLSALAEGTSFAVYKNECCAIKLITSIGVIVIPKTATTYSTQIFKTPFTVTAVEVVDGTCDLASVTVISNLSA